MKNFSIGFLLTLVAIFTSCSKDDESTPEFIGESVGAYSYSARAFDSNNTVVGTITGDLTLSRNGDDITIIVDDGETLKTSRVELASNGYGFDIEAAILVDEEGDLVNRIGDASANLGGKSYHGRYDTGSKQIFLNVAYIYQDDQFAEFNFSIEVTATKN